MTDMDHAREEERPATFEECLAELQSVVRDLEDGSLGLDQSIARFEQGIALLRRCYQTLQGAEQRIEILLGFDKQDAPQTAAYDASATIETRGKSPGRRSRAKASREPAPEPGPSIPEANEEKSGHLF